jgi:hypothetical protein
MEQILQEQINSLAINDPFKLNIDKKEDISAIFDNKDIAISEFKTINNNIEIRKTISSLNKEINRSKNISTIKDVAQVNKQDFNTSQKPKKIDFNSSQKTKKDFNSSQKFTRKDFDSSQK